MPAKKLDFISQYRSKKKEAIERERQERLDLEKRAPQIIDPSFELFGHKSPANQYEHNTRNAGPNTFQSSSTSNDDWTFHNRRTSSMPHSYQFEPYCEVTPKSSVSSSNSNYSNRTTYTDNELAWDSCSTSRSRPQSYLPPLPSVQSYSGLDLQRPSAYKPRRSMSMDQVASGQDSSSVYDLPYTTAVSSHSYQTSQPYRLEASLSRPFSLSEPYDALDELGGSEPAQQDRNASKLTSIPEHGSVSGHHDDLTKRGYIR